MEREKDIKGYEGLYKITSDGMVIGLTSGKTTIGYLNNGGYRLAHLYKNNKRKMILVHRLVATAFIPNPMKYDFVNHIDSNRQNNSVENLEWCTKSYNTKYSYDNTNRKSKMNWKKGGDNANSKAVAQIDINTGMEVARYDSIKCAERATGILNHSIVSMLNGRYKTAGGYKWKRL